MWKYPAAANVQEVLNNLPSLTRTSETKGASSRTGYNIPDITDSQDTLNQSPAPSGVFNAQEQSFNDTAASYGGEQANYPDQIKSASDNSGKFDVNNNNIPYQNTGVPRGAFILESNTIALLEDADLSTFQHELGHFFLESLITFANDLRLFLSYLCGDEVQTISFGAKSCFLSHLCGDEVRFAAKPRPVNFLSHLCGYEVMLITTIMFLIFLSHLCGDEGEQSNTTTAPSFLSHLCGDEDRKDIRR